METFSIIDDPEIFGMHENANIVYQVIRVSETESGETRNNLEYL